MTGFERTELSLMERRKLRAMHEIQDAALQLFEDSDFRNVSVEQVAAAAAVSTSTVYRYFGTKENLVVWDEFDPRVLEFLATSGGDSTDPAELLEIATAGARLLVTSMIGTVDENKIERRMRLMTTQPEIRAGQLRQVQLVEEQVRNIFAARLGLGRDDLLPRLVAAQGVWSFVAAVDHWVATEFAEPLPELLDRTIDIVHRSLSAALLPA